MGWKIFDYRCSECGEEFESMEQDAEDEVWCPVVFCESPLEVCGARADYLPSANLGWSNNKEAQTEMLKKRSREHTAKEQKNGNMMGPKDLPKL
jgi:hypothetical protein